MREGVPSIGLMISLEAEAMARVQLRVHDEAPRLTLKTLLESDGHTIVERDPNIVLTDDVDYAIRAASSTPSLVLAAASQIGGAVAAMRNGVYGYIFVPFLPGEAALMINRALEGSWASKDSSSEIAPLELVEAEHILRVLRMCKHNQAKAARILGIGRNTLWRKLKKIRGGGPGNVAREAGRPNQGG